jgi:hypothetical protein
MPNWIDHTQGTDTDYPSIGCGMVYLSWMISLGYTLAQITQAGGRTLDENYRALTGKSTAWADMMAAVAGISITDDDPFGGAVPVPQPGPAPGPAPGPKPGPAPSGGPPKAEAQSALDDAQAAMGIMQDALNTLSDVVNAMPDDPPSAGKGHEDLDPQP